MARNAAKAPVPNIPPYREEPTDVKKDIQDWLQRFRTYMTCVRYSIGQQQLSDDYKKSCLELSLGADGAKDFARNPEYQRKDQMTYDEFEAAVEAHFRKRRSVIKARVDFNRRYQEAGESVHEYVQELRRIGEDCQFDQLDNQIQTQLVTGTNDHRAQQELMARIDLPDLDDIIEILQASETANEDLRKLRPHTTNVDTARVVTTGRGRGGFGTRGRNNRGRGNFGNRGGFQQQRQRCEACGSEDHRTRDHRCPAIGKTCTRCGRMNHFANVCRAATPSYNTASRGRMMRGRGQNYNHRGFNYRGRTGAAINLDNDRDEEARRCQEPSTQSNSTAEQVQVTEEPPLLLHETFYIRNESREYQPVRMLVDTGANTSIISEDTWRKKLSAVPMKRVKKELRGADGKYLQGCIGTIATKVAFGGRVQSGRMYVFKGSGLDTIGVNFLKPLKAVVNCEKMTLQVAKAISTNDILHEFPELTSEDMGTYSGRPHRIQIKDGTIPAAARLRPVPFRMIEAVKQEIVKMDKLGIWEPVRKSEWVHPLVVVPKKDSGVRITSDLTRLNDAVIPDRHPLPRIKGIFRELRECTRFSKLDLKKGYFHVPLAEESRDLTTTITPLGLRRYKRLPMGLKDSASAFQYRLQETLSGIEGVRVYIDDILIGGRTPVEHDFRLRQVLCKLQKAGFRLQTEKLIINRNEIPAFGYLFSAEGLRPDPANVKAIQEAPPPYDVKGLQRFLGMVNFFQDFIYDAATVLEPLRRLTRHNEPFHWGKQQEAAFRTVKAMLVKTVQLKCFDDSLATVVTVDASDVGIGAMLTQAKNGRERPCGFFSRTLDSAQRNYSASEKEALACILALEHWEELLLGRRFLLRTDHQALTSILSTPKSRRQSSKFIRWKERLAEFDFQVQYLPGPHNFVADYLSRLDQPEDKEEKGICIQVAGIQLRRLQQSAREDELYQKAKEEIRKGHWLAKNPIVALVRPVRARVKVEDDLIKVGDRIVLPDSCVRDVLEEAHRGHPGMVRMKQLLRRTYLWARMTKQVEEMVNNCEKCQASSKTKRRSTEPQMTAIPRPTTPGAQWGIDITGPFPNGLYIVVAIDYATRYPEYLTTKMITTECIARWLKEMWNRVGLPEAVVTDNGTQFTSTNFKKMLQDLDIHQYTIAVYNPQENGLVERFNKYLKFGIQTFDSGRNWKEQLETLVAAYRRMPSHEGGMSPMDLFFGRKARGPLEPNMQQPMRWTEEQKQELLAGEGPKEQLQKFVGRSVYKLGDKVLVKRPQVPKGESPWKGPLEVLQVLGRFTFLLDDRQVWNARKMKHWVKKP